MRVIMTGGGTGGHIYPALAIARGIMDRWPRAKIIFVGTREGMEKDIVPESGFEFRTISAKGLNRSSLVKAASSALKVPIGFWQARNIIKEFNPDVVVGTGGYVSYPVVLAAGIMQFKTVIHEQNALPGLANRALGKRADRIMLTFPEAAAYFPEDKTTVTGLPVRPEILTATRREAASFFALKEDRFTLVVFGGSRGAQRINRAVEGLVEQLSANGIQLIWITGEQHYATIQESIVSRGNIDNVRIYPYLFNMELALAMADLAVCRAGAATLSELAVRGVPAILVPYPYAAENHQEKNARYLEKKGAALVIIDEFLDQQTLAAKINELLNNKFRLLRMGQIMKNEGRPRALEDILDIIEEVVESKKEIDSP
ncbi:MAG: undecaprenyldiphospho-muramoylpentapeptide beta-N-acetylglucosaminyltransferase [Syntrophomonadaceae bacterium]|nr:undecaprenyldiphospho-muramoylpentapeptide beta-N-acetylglucosaminyltransferase [Syntrophomonadaceae bacterium]